MKMKIFVFILILLLSACTTKKEFLIGEVISFNSIPIRANLEEVLKNPEKFSNKQISVAGQIAIWSESKTLCLENPSENLKVEERCLTVSFAESMYETFKTENGDYADRIKGNHSGQYVLITGYFRMIHIPTESEIEEIENENGVGIPFARTHLLSGVYRMKQIKK
jgi:hypothetical protein